MKKILLLLLLSTTLIWSCKEKIGKIQNAAKAVVYPGTPHAKIKIQYTAQIALFKEVRLLEVKIKNKHKEEFQLKNISITDAKTGKIMKTDTILPAGNYFMDARMPYDKNREEAKDKMIVLLSGDKTTYKYVIDIIKKEPVKHS